MNEKTGGYSPPVSVCLSENNVSINAKRFAKFHMNLALLCERDFKGNPVMLTITHLAFVDFFHGVRGKAFLCLFLCFAVHDQNRLEHGFTHFGDGLDKALAHINGNFHFLYLTFLVSFSLLLGAFPTLIIA
nr:MAG TPA: hypothetical protein [Caudoviricetes sp.]